MSSSKGVRVIRSPSESSSVAELDEGGESGGGPGPSVEVDRGEVSTGEIDKSLRWEWVDTCGSPECSLLDSSSRLWVRENLRLVK